MIKTILFFLCIVPVLAMSDGYTPPSGVVDYSGVITTLQTGKVSQAVYDVADATTNRVAKTGDTVTGPMLSTAVSALTGPAADELATAGWVRGLMTSGNILYFANTTSSVNTAYGSFNAETQALQFIVSVASVTNTQYAIMGMSTSRFTRVAGPMFASAWINQIDNGALNSLTCHPEFYYTYDGTNLFGDYEAQAQAISATTTSKYDWVVSFPNITATNTAGFYIVAKMKIDVAVNAGIKIVSGGATPSQIGFSIPVTAIDLDPYLTTQAWLAADSTTNAMQKNIQLSTNSTLQGNIDAKLGVSFTNSYLITSNQVVVMLTSKVDQATYNLALPTTNYMQRDVQISSNATLQGNINGKLAMTNGTAVGTFTHQNTSFAGVTNGSYWTYYGTTQAVYTIYVGTNLCNIKFSL